MATTDEAEIATELAKQVLALKKDKATAADKKLKELTTAANDLQDKMAKMAKQRSKIEGDRGANPADIKQYNAELVELKKAAEAVAKLCQPYRKTRTPEAAVSIFNAATRMNKVSEVKVKQ